MSQHLETPLGTLLGVRARDVQHALAKQLLDLPVGPTHREALLQQVRRVHDLGDRILYELQRLPAEYGATPAGQHFALCVTGAYAHCARASTHMATAFQSLTKDAVLGPDGFPEGQLGYKLGHAAALRSLRRAQQVLEEGAEHLASPAFARTPGKKPKHASPAEPAPQEGVPPPRLQR
ncbi:hypothetical protein ACQPZG_31730 [Streptomyces sp. CA-294286]|uniref:hypothetical protein n=1 Tax=Streptomyces sp. CA-294286 TaxID=3240070 RepID=UPI003D8FEDA7